MAPPDANVTVALGGHVVLGHYPQRTKVVATISGSSTINDGLISSTATLEGALSGAGGEVSLNSDIQGLSAGHTVAASITDTIDVQGDVILGQRGQTIFVGDDGRPWTMTGSATASVTRVDAKLGIGVQFRDTYTTDSTREFPGYSIRLMARSVGGQTLAAADPASWMFVPDDHSLATPACDAVTRTWCDFTPTKSGSVTMIGYANSGPPVPARIHINVVGTKELTVVCMPTAPVREGDVHCHVRLSDGSEFTLKRLRSTDAKLGDLIAQEIFDLTTSDYDWHGQAGTATNVEAVALVDGTETTANGSFTITPRIFLDAIQPNSPPPIFAHGQPFLLDDYPGMVKTPTGATLLEGGLGRTLHMYPDYDYLKISSGPNKNIVGVKNFRWVDPRPPGSPTQVAAGMYLTAALFAGDPFYQKQDGKNGVCSSADMDGLRNDINTHELRHYGAAIQLRQQMRLHELYEAVYAIAPQGMTLEFKVELNQPVIFYLKGITQLDAAIDGNPATAAKSSLSCELRF
ncbi:MAG: hypothetical protein ABJE10_04050 [bacterium]